jgi:PAS domain S-box-containing protein
VVPADAAKENSAPEFAPWLDELPDGLLVCAPDGTILVANAPLLAMSGYAGVGLIGANVEQLVPLASRFRHAALRRGFLDANRARPMGPGEHLTLCRRDGTELPVEISLSPLDVAGPRDGPNSGQRGVVAIVRDVSERLHAEAAIRNSAELLALADERERIARDLHDTVLQRLFGLGLELQAGAIRATPDVAKRIEHAVDEIDLIIREIRTAVFTFGSAGRQGSLGQELAVAVSQAKRVLGFAPRLRVDGPLESAITPTIRIELMASLREALTNIARHAGATEAEIELHANDMVRMRVLDNGRGISDDLDTSSGNGLRNLVERARLLGGGCSIQRRPDRGTLLEWWVPLPR